MRSVKTAISYFRLSCVCLWVCVLLAYAGGIVLRFIYFINIKSNYMFTCMDEVLCSW